MRVMGLDYGSRTVGVAVCDPLGLTAQALETITRDEENKLRPTLRRIEALIAEYEIETIVLGYPKNMDDSIGERAQKTEEFKHMLEKRTGLEVILWDERLTTVAANEILMESGVRREDRKKVIDKIAAGLILQGYLDYRREK
ncbi:Holliday junction resolvase RuvX [Clostridium sp. chh4-2]|uniref:Holliday junction resolvase RuvX n=1 Tax=Clostridium sp. chh4-2 TaxID=2067550 RepID=UPI000CCEA22E|nr:Holliday junction resolvase RuvX [Clostridium sp. chh4-2]PNV63457.1 Holliday junction resolvase RuvX [Clostridium sp. chh4-2]